MHEYRHRIAVTIGLIICVIISIFGVVVSIIDIASLQSKSGVFECILISISNIFMIGISSLTLSYTFKSYKNGSMFMKEFTLGSRNTIKKKTTIAYFILGIITLGLAILFILMLTNVVNNTVFPKGLDAALLSFMAILMTTGFGFSTYPYAVNRDLKEKKKNELHN